jgi:hypothetical protein
MKLNTRLLEYFLIRFGLATPANANERFAKKIIFLVLMVFVLSTGLIVYLCRPYVAMIEADHTQNRLRHDVATFKDAVLLFKEEHGRYPTSLEDIATNSIGLMKNWADEKLCDPRNDKYEIIVHSNWFALIVAAKGTALNPPMALSRRVAENE